MLLCFRKYLSWLWNENFGFAPSLHRKGGLYINRSKQNLKKFKIRSEIIATNNVEQ